MYKQKETRFDEKKNTLVYVDTGRKVRTKKNQSTAQATSQISQTPESSLQTRLLETREAYVKALAAVRLEEARKRIEDEVRKEVFNAKVV
jgi:hypothetical protein